MDTFDSTKYTLHFDANAVIDSFEPKCVKDAKEAWDKFSGLLGLISAKGKEMEIADLKAFTEKLIKTADIKVKKETKKRK